MNPRAQELLNLVIRGFLRRRFKLPWGGAFEVEAAGAALTDAKYSALSELEWWRNAGPAGEKRTPVRVSFVDGEKPYYEVSIRQELVCGDKFDEEAVARCMLFAVAKVISGQTEGAAEAEELPRVCEYHDTCTVYDFESFRDNRRGQ